MAPTLPDAEAAQRSQLQAARARELHSSGPKTDFALTITLDHPMGAPQKISHEIALSRDSNSNVVDYFRRTQRHLRAKAAVGEPRQAVGI